MNGKTLEEADQFKYLAWIHTIQRRHINKVGEDQTGASTLSHNNLLWLSVNKAINYGEKSHQFSDKG